MRGGVRPDGNETARVIAECHQKERATRRSRACGAFAIGVLLVLAHTRAWSDPAPLGLVPPLKLTRVVYFKDGGTTMFEVTDSKGHTIVGGFDGRTRAVQTPSPPDSWVFDATPRHMYLDAEHPARPSARLLPLWGDEERAVVRMLVGVLDEEMPEWRTRLLSVENISTLPDSRTMDLWRIAGRSAAREQMLDEIDRGQLASDDCLRSYLGIVYPIRLESVAWDDSAAAYTVSLTDFGETVFTITVPADSAGSEPRPSRMRRRYEFAHPFGSLGDRCALTALSLAVPSNAAERDRIEGVDLLDGLMETVRMRIRRIFETEATR